MPTICKISLDATEYKRQLAEVVEQSRAAAEQMSAVSGSSATGATISVDASQVDEAGQKVADLTTSVASIMGAEAATISVDASQVDKAGQKVADLLAKDGSNVNITVSSDPSALTDTAAAADALAGGTQKAAAASKGMLGGLKALRAGISGIKVAIGGVMVALTAIIALAKLLYSIWERGQTQLQILQRNAAEFAELRAKNEELIRTSDGYMSKLGELASAEKLSNSQKSEALQLIRELQKGYGDLGVTLDATTGRITGFHGAMVEKINRDAEKKRNDIKNEIQELMEQRELLGKRSRQSVRFGRLFGGENADELARQIDEINAKVNKLRMQMPSRRDQQKQIDAFREKVDAEQEDREKTLSDEDFAARDQERLVDAKILAIKKPQDGSVDAKRFRELEYNLGTDDAGQLLALEKEFEIKRGIWQTKKQKLQEIDGKSSQISEELKRQVEIEQGVHTSQADKQAAGDKIRDLKEKRNEVWKKQIPLSKEVKQAEYEYRQAEAEYNKFSKRSKQKFSKQMTPQIFDMQWNIRESMGGEAEKFAYRERARYDARRALGRPLNGWQTKAVDQVADLKHEYEKLQRDSAQIRGVDLSIKTNALTSRGGFSSGVVAPDADRWSRLQYDITQKNAQKLQSIDDQLKKLMENYQLQDVV